MTQPLLKKLISPIERFLALQASSGIVLLISAILALIFANTPFLEGMYSALLHYPVSIGAGHSTLTLSLHHLVNDALMVIFFFVVGLEIKRELVQGHLSSKTEAFLPFIAALGGMIVPAGIYLLINAPYQQGIMGWGIPMATDIAFAIGVLAFVSKRIPLSLKIFLLALATIDDIGAVLVIAAFYSSEISGYWISISALVTFFIFCLKQLRVESYLIYLLLGVVLWFCVLNSGIHTTIAGIILGIMTPVRTLYTRKTDLDEELKKVISEAQPSTYLLEKIKKKISRLQSPAQFLIERLHLFVSFLIMPIFAFFNSGLKFGEQSFTLSNESFSNPVFLGVLLGLFVGKPVGVVLFSWVAVHWKLARWPSHTHIMHILGIGFLSGIGFTMALFINNLSFSNDFMLSNYAKAAILLASVLSGVIGFIILRFYGDKYKK